MPLAAAFLFQKLSKLLGPERTAFSAGTDRAF
jgi:hypothetical protein